jgi:ParB family transcriptional regulator, chromosome partitioning protein
MTTIESIISQPQLIHVAKLEKSPLNVRKTLTREGIDEMKASIASHGLMQNLVVTAAADGGYRVVAGSRRLAALRELHEEGKLAADHAVPCQVVAEEHAHELSLAENTVRLTMHPADQFEAFAELIAQGRTAAEVAQHFGIEESLVLKRMKLGSVAPALIQAYRDDKLALECLMAFTLTDDHRRQLKVYKSLQDWQKDDPHHIRACLTEKLIDADCKMARFVGLEAYAAAGGTTRADLFENEVYLEKPALLDRLATEKLNAIRRDLEAEGWAWIEINPDRDHSFIARSGRLQPVLIDAPKALTDQHALLRDELAKLAETIKATQNEADRAALEQKQSDDSRRCEQLEEILSAHVGFDRMLKKLAGCYVSIGQDGTPFIDKGLVKPAQRKQLEQLQAGEEAAAPQAQAKAQADDRMPATLYRDLAACRQEAAQAEIARHPATAFDLMVFHAARSTLATPALGGPDVRFARSYPSIADEKQSSPAAAALKAVRASLPSAWMRHAGDVEQFAAFRALTDAEKQALLAYCVAVTLPPSLAPAKGKKPSAFDAALSLTGASMAAYWRPSKGNYLGRVTRDQLLALGREVLGEQWAQARAKEKKGALVDQLDRAFCAPEKQARTPEQVEKLKSWLPAGMAFVLAAAGNKPTGAKKTRKAA